MNVALSLQKRIRLSGRTRWLVFIGAALLFVLVFQNEPYLIRVGVLALLYATLTVSLNLVNGYTGLFSLGHAAFYGIGAYTSALLALDLNWPFWLCFLAGGLVAMFFGALVSLPAAQLRGIYLAIITLAFAEITRLMIINLQWLTRGPFGLPGIPPPALFGYEITSDAGVYLLSLVLLLLTVYVIERIMHARAGYALLAIREDEQAAAASGIKVFRYKVLAFANAAFFAGLSGSVYAHYTRFISYDSFTLNESFAVLSMLVFGGIGSTPGAILGAFLLTAIPEVFRFAADYRMVIYGVVLTLVILFRPQGLLGKSRLSLPGIQRAKPERSRRGTA